MAWRGVEPGGRGWGRRPAACRPATSTCICTPPCFIPAPLPPCSLVTALDYADPYLNPYQEFQEWKRHPFVARLLEGGTCLQVRRRAQAAAAAPQGLHGAALKHGLPTPAVWRTHAERGRLAVDPGAHVPGRCAGGRLCRLPKCAQNQGGKQGGGVLGLRGCFERGGRTRQGQVRECPVPHVAAHGAPRDHPCTAHTPCAGHAHGHEVGHAGGRGCFQRHGQPAGRQAAGSVGVRDQPAHVMGALRWGQAGQLRVHPSGAASGAVF